MGRGEFVVQQGKERALPGNLPLYEGYAENEMRHGEIENLVGLADFLEGEAVGRTEGGRYEIRRGAKVKDLAAQIAADYGARGVTEINVNPLGVVVLGVGGVEDSIRHFISNKSSNTEHKQMVVDVFPLVPDVLQKGVLVEYGRQLDNPRLVSYIYMAPVVVRGKDSIMSVRVRRAEGQEKGRFYLHGVELREAIKEQSRDVRLGQDADSEVGWSSGANSRDVFRIAKKAFAVKEKNAHLSQMRSTRHEVRSTK